MEKFLALITACAAAIGSIASCSDKVWHAPSAPAPAPAPSAPAPSQQQSSVPPQSPAADAVSPKEPSSDAETPATSNPSMSVVSSSFPGIALEKYHELKALNAVPVVGDSGEAAENRLVQAHRKVELASFLAENAHLLTQLTGANSDYADAIAEAGKLPYYQAEAVRLEAAWRR